MKLQFILLLSLLCFIQQAHSFTEVCQKLSVSTNITESKTDIIKHGKVLKFWEKDSDDPMLSQSSLAIDYFYITVHDIHAKITDKDLRITQNDDQFSDSQISVVHSKNLGKDIWQYTVAVKYRCKQAGGALITYRVDFMIPNCGTNTVYWKKLCGNPLAPRTGLALDININKKYNQTIVQNGLLQKAQYFDNNLDSFAFKVNKHQRSMTFFIYMDVNEEETTQKLQDESDPFEILKDAMLLIPEERVDPLFIDADEEIMNPQVLGRFVNGGTITKQRTRIDVKFNCKRYGQSTVQLQIPLPYFKDINLFFIKQCGHNLKNEFVDLERSFGLTYLIIFLSFIVFVLWTAYNVIQLNKGGIDAMPGIRYAYEFLIQFSIVQDIILKSQNFLKDTKIKLRNKEKLDDDDVEQNTEQKENQEESQQNNIQMDDIKAGNYGSL